MSFERLQMAQQVKDEQRKVIEGQIAVLEEIISGHEGSHMVDRIKAKIAELRKELGE
jgi:hypothetical protein